MELQLTGGAALIVISGLLLLLLNRGIREFLAWILKRPAPPEWRRGTKASVFVSGLLSMIFGIVIMVQPLYLASRTVPTSTLVPSTHTPTPSPEPPTVTPTETLEPTPTQKPTETNTPTPTPTNTPTNTATSTPPARVLFNFDDGIQGWQAAVDWPGAETSLSIEPSAKAGYNSGALWGNFNFAQTNADYARATFYLVFPAPENWTSAVTPTLRFDARSLPPTGGEIKATIMVKTEEQGCYYEHREYQRVGQQEEFTTLEFPLNVPYYKNDCGHSGEYNEPLIGKDKVLELALVFIPDPDEARFAGEVLIDNVTVVEELQSQ